MLRERKNRTGLNLIARMVAAEERTAKLAALRVGRPRTSHRVETIIDEMKHISFGGGAAAQRSGEGGKCGGGMGGQQTGGIKGGAKRKTHAGRK